MPQYVVSACLAGLPCRYDGGSNPCAQVMELVRRGEALPLCPEALAELPVPRPPCELQTQDENAPRHNTTDRETPREGLSPCPQKPHTLQACTGQIEELECERRECERLECEGREHEGLKCDGLDKPEGREKSEGPMKNTDPMKNAGQVKSEQPTKNEQHSCVSFRVMSKDGRDMTAAFARGARLALEATLAHGCTHAILKSRSPSCGINGIYDGTFSKTLVPGMGLWARLLAEHGLELRSEEDVEA